MELLLFHSHCFCNGHIYKGKKNKSNLTFLFPRSGLQDIFREAEVTICRVHIRQLICGLRRHWILCVIDPEADVVYYLDPLRKENCPIGDDLRSVVETALLIYSTVKTV
ncbi:uncharacterized protein LOC110708335 isoform X2 [Chenopodium quinoa]|uniref:uncharacterized protein LOC110708335 isoform X2 n=1 Tax=Chenopodium quinoa TaxID=63459 RepID=UPI000B780CD5|nr:uncharacterized protein LOC110708335 isoform X2 [Chenopodium quinoa]